MDQLYDTYYQFGNINDKTLSFNEVYSRCFDSVKDRLKRLPSASIENKEQLRRATTARKPYVYNLCSDLQPPLLPMDTWTSNAPPNQKVRIIKHQFNQHHTSNPLNKLDVDGTQLVDIAELNRTYSRYYKNKSSGIQIPQLHNREQELECIKKTSLQWLLKDLAPKNRTKRFVCDCILCFILSIISSIIPCILLHRVRLRCTNQYTVNYTIHHTISYYIY